MGGVGLARGAIGVRFKADSDSSPVRRTNSSRRGGWSENEIAVRSHNKTAEYHAVADVSPQRRSEQWKIGRKDASQESREIKNREEQS